MKLKVLSNKFSATSMIILTDKILTYSNAYNKYLSSLLLYQCEMVILKTM